MKSIQFQKNNILIHLSDKEEKWLTKIGASFDPNESLASIYMEGRKYSSMKAPIDEEDDKAAEQLTMKFRIMYNAYKEALEEKLVHEGIVNVRHKNLVRAFAKSNYDLDEAFAYATRHIFTDLKRAKDELNAIRKIIRAHTSEGRDCPVALHRLSEGLSERCRDLLNEYRGKLRSDLMKDGFKKVQDDDLNRALSSANWNWELAKKKYKRMLTLRDQYGW